MKNNVRIAFALVFTIVLAGCSSNTGCHPSDGGGPIGSNPVPPVNVQTTECAEGQSDFTSTLLNTTFLDRGPIADGPVPTSVGIAPPEARSTAPTRLIEESDVVKLVDRTLYVLNAYRGLQIIDLTDVAAPRRLCRQPLSGHPVEMYIRDGRALVIVSANAPGYNIQPVSSDALSVSPSYSSQVRIINVTSCQNLAIEGGIDIAGDIFDTRLVGDVLYTVANQSNPYDYRHVDPPDTQGTTTVTSIQVADPGHIVQVQRLDFPREGYDHHINVTNDTIVIAASDWRTPCTGPVTDVINLTCSTGGYVTKFRLVDITSPDGKMTLGAEWTASGLLQDRWGMDVHEQSKTFRVITTANPWNSHPILTTFTFDGSADVRKLAELKITLPRPERLTSARFDGNRAYAVTFDQRDPLITLDLTDPANPKQAGVLDVPGWSDHIEPRGNRLIAFGHDQDPVTGNWGLQVSLFDVSDLKNPIMLKRVQFDSGWGFIAGSRDDFQKVFKVFDELGLILVPFRSYNHNVSIPDGQWYKDGVQLIDFDLTQDTLVKRGFAESKGLVERALSLDGHVLSVSDTNFQVFDAHDRDHPRLVATLELTLNVLGMTIPTSYEYGALLTGSFSYGWESELRIVPLSSSQLLDEATASSTTPLTGFNGRLFQNGRFIYFTSQPPEGKGTVQVIDISDPVMPKMRGKFVSDLPENTYINEMLQVDHDLLVVHLRRHASYCIECDHFAGPPLPSAPSDELAVIDLSDPDNPRLASRVNLGGYYSTGEIQSRGRVVYFSAVRVDKNISRHYLVRVDLSNPVSPNKLPEINIPGALIDISHNGHYVYTSDNVFTENRSQLTLFASALVGDKAYLRGEVKLPDYAGDFIYASTGFIYFTMSSYESRTDSRINGSGLVSISGPALALNAVDVRHARDLKVTPSTKIQNAFGSLRKVSGNKALIDLSGFGLAIFDVGAQPPTFNKLVRQGWIADIQVRGDRVFILSGPYGVEVIDLKSGT